MGYGNFGGFGGANMNQLMRQAQKMQEDMAKAKEELENTVFTSSVGGGMNIEDEFVDPDYKEILEDLVISAVNDCLEQITRKEQSTMPSVPGLF